MVTALAIGEVVLTTLMDIEFPNDVIPFEIPYKRYTLSSKHESDTKPVILPAV